MNDISSRIKHALKHRNIKAKELSEMTGISRSSISEWLSGKYEPKQDKIFIIANALNVDEAWLLGLDVPIERKSTITSIYNELEPPRQQKVYSFAEHELKEQKSYRDKRDNDLDSYRKRKQEIQTWEEIDYYGSAAAGTGEFLIDEHKETITLPSSIIPPGADFCLIVNGNSMEPVILDGSYVFIDKTHEIPSGTISAVMVNREAFIKRVWFENGHARLESFNDKYDDIIVTEEDDFYIIGKVVM